MNQLQDYVAAAVQQTREVFVRDLPHPFLLLKLVAEESNEEWSFRTRTMVRVRSGNALRLSTEAERYRVYALVKGWRNPWPERISIGRARNNDVVLLDQSVSKLHAHFVTSTDGSMALVDAGSRNGTRINDTKLTPGERGIVRPGDTVVIGALFMTLVDANGLYDLIHEKLSR